ncbi:MAG: SusF/SusE family outer membrane protein, partial [Bacteroidales bacterium]|nr:SusF/SusE family outer membrane protein [Bacteroidales bacterium]
ADGCFDLYVNPADNVAKVTEASGAKVSSKIGGGEEPPAPVITGWNIIGLNGDWENDIIATQNGNVWTVYATANEETTFKWRKDGDWAENYGGTLVALGEPFTAVPGGDDIKVGPGFYKIDLDTEALTITVSNGEMYSLIGEINGDSWSKDVVMTENNGIWSSVTVSIEGGFKIRHNASWADEDVYGAEDGFTAEPGVAFTAVQPGSNISIAPGQYKVTFNPATKEVLIGESKYPEHLYMIGEEFGGWDWNSDGVVEMTPVVHNPDWGAEAEGQFWAVRYISAGKGFKFCSQRAWSGDFWGLTYNDGFTEAGGNCTVAEDGIYLIHIDMKNEKVHVEPARVYGIGNCFGGWTTEMPDALFKAEGKVLKATTVGEGELRMYVASSIATSDWWTREFIFFEDGVIDYRGDDEGQGDQARFNVLTGQTVTLDFNAGTGTVEGEGQASELPETMYIIGEGIGGWDWAGDYIVDMTPVNGKKGQFWAIRYIEGGKGFKFCAVKDWNGDFFSLGEDIGFTTEGGNCFVAENGVYMIYVDCDAKKICVEKAQVYGIGDCFGGWDQGMADALFVEQDGKLVGTVKADGELRMYAASSIATSDWWTREFIILDGKIVYRGNGDDQERVRVNAGSKVTLDFNAGTGTIESGGDQPAAGITIDGDMSDWANVEGATSDGVYKVLKATNDDEFFYIYSMRNKKRGNELWGSNKGYYYYDFDMDDNAETGDYAEGSHGNFEAWMYLYLFGGTPEAPDFWESPKGDGKPSSSVIADVLCKGVVDDNPEVEGLIETEVRIPRANLPAVEKGQTISITSWGNKDANLMKVTFTVK